MRKQFLVIALITISCIESYSQIIFENGYFINESNQKIECLIKNIDWLNNPTEFEYKLSQHDVVQKATIQTVKEFGINSVSKYIRAKTNIDRSSDQLDELSSERNPKFQEELLFLKVLIEGQASLFLYNDGDLTRFFYKLNDSEIEQLVFKRYLIDNSYVTDNKVSVNNYFKQQLLLKLQCEEIQLNDLEKVGYNRQDLERIFRKYHECTGSNYINLEQKQTKDRFNLNIRPGLNYSSFKMRYYETSFFDPDFENSIGIRFGIETEYILPFNKNKWSIIIEPTYQYYKLEESKDMSRFVSGGILVSKVDYKSIELPVGLRHYFYFNDKSKLFTNVSYVIDFPINSSIKFLRNYDPSKSELEIKRSRNLALGAGYQYKNKYSIEIRYNTYREILGGNSHLEWTTNYHSLNIICGLSMF